MTDSVSDMDKRRYLFAAGWTETMAGWWNPPHYIACWPLEEAFAMAQRDEQCRFERLKGKVPCS